MMDKEEAMELLAEEGHQQTTQREYMIDMCLEGPGHFTVADLCDIDREKKNKLSRATVYNNVHVLEDIGFLRELPDLGSPVYYEVRKSPHPHANCESCGEIMDIPVDLESRVENWDIRLEINNVSMTLSGLCVSCA